MSPAPLSVRGSRPTHGRYSGQTRPVRLFIHRAELASFDCGPTAQPMLPRAKCVCASSRDAASWRKPHRGPPAEGQPAEGPRVEVVPSAEVAPSAGAPARPPCQHSSWRTRAARQRCSVSLPHSAMKAAVRACKKGAVFCAVRPIAPSRGSNPAAMAASSR